jgi:hypothetical protein
MEATTTPTAAVESTATATAVEAATTAPMHGVSNTRRAAK